MIRTIRLRVYPGPIEGAAAIHAMLAAVRRYKNNLTEVQQTYRKKWKDERTAAAPAFAAAETAYELAAGEVEALEEATKAQRAKARKGKKAPPELAEAKARRKEAAARLKEERAKIDPALLKAITQRLQREEAAVVKAATAEARQGRKECDKDPSTDWVSLDGDGISQDAARIDWSRVTRPRRLLVLHGQALYKIAHSPTPEERRTWTRVLSAPELSGVWAELDLSLRKLTEEEKSNLAEGLRLPEIPGLTSAGAYEAQQDLQRSKETAGPKGPRFRSHDGGGTIPIQIPAVGMSERVVLDALKEADLHASAAKVLTEAGRIKLVRGRAPLFVTDEFKEDGTSKNVELAEGLNGWTDKDGVVHAGWRDSPDGLEHRGHSEEAWQKALGACVPLRTWSDLTGGRLGGVSLEHLPRAEWRKAWPKGRGDRPGQQLPDPSSRRRGDEKIAYGLVRMQVNRDKAEAVIPVCEPRDRLPPPGAQVKQVELHARPLGIGKNGERRLRYSILATVDDPRPRLGKRRGVVAVNVGWRPRPDGSVRCGYFVGDDGQHGEIVVPAEILKSLEHADSLRAIRDRAFDLAKVEVCQFLSALAEPPAWLIEALRPRKPRPASGAEGVPEAAENDVVDTRGGLRPKHILLWRDARRLERLFVVRSFVDGCLVESPGPWLEHRLPGDEMIVQRLAGPLLQENGQDRAWLPQHYHLLSWEQDVRRKALARRLALFQGWGKRLGERYGTLLLEDFDLTEERRRPRVEEGTQKERTPLVKLMNAAAPGEIRKWLAMGTEARGGEVVKKTVPLATQRCHRCGSEQRWDAAKSIIHTCRSCGTLWDQDENNDRNRLADYAQAGKVSDGTQVGLAGCGL